MTEDELLAAEFALGLLDAPEFGGAEARVAHDPAFADLVEWWRAELHMIYAPAVVPPSHLWRAIETRLATNDDAPAANPWKWATAAMSAVAAALLGVIALRPEPAPVVKQVSQTSIPAPPLLANLSGARGSVVTISYDPGTHAAIVSPVVLRAGARDAELWVIPDGSSKPVSMGVIDAKSPRVRRLDAAQAALMAAGATLAISLEPIGGSTTGSPTGPVVATGKIVRV